MDVIVTNKVRWSLAATIIIIAAGIVALADIVISKTFLCAILMPVWVGISVVCMLMLHAIDLNNLAHIRFTDNEVVITVCIFHNGSYTTRVYHAKFIDITSIFEDKGTGVVTISGLFDCFEIAAAGTKEASDLIVGLGSRCDSHLSIKLVPVNSHSIHKYISDNSPLHVASK